MINVSDKKVFYMTVE